MLTKGKKLIHTMKKFLIMLCLFAATATVAAAQDKFPMVTIPEEVTDPMQREGI